MPRNLRLAIACIQMQTHLAAQAESAANVEAEKLTLAVREPYAESVTDRRFWVKAKAKGDKVNGKRKRNPDRWR